VGAVVRRGTRATPRFYGQFKDLDGRYKMRALKGCRTSEEAARALAKMELRISHIVLPLVAYSALSVSGILLPRDPGPWLFVVAASTLLLLFVGIHNAWDSVTYIALQRQTRPEGNTPP
jgi:hypothetical protein